MPIATQLKSIYARHAKLVIVVVGLILVTALAVTLAPVGIRLAAISWLEADGRNKATIENVDFNPFTGVLVVEGLDTHAPSGRGLKLARLTTNLEMTGFVQKRFHLKTLDISDGTLDIEIGSAGTPRLPGFPPASGGDRDPESLSGWLVGLDEFAIRNFALRVSNGKDTAEIRIQDFGLENLSQWHITEPAALNSMLRIGKGNLRISGRIKPFAESPAFEMQLSATALDAGRLDSVVKVPGIRKLSGNVTGTLDIGATLKDRRRAEASIKGTVSLERLGLHIKTNAGSPLAPLAELLPGAEPATPQKPDAFRLVADRARLEGLDLSLAAGGGAPMRFAISGSTHIDGFELSDGVAAVRQGSFRWKGRLGYMRGDDAAMALDVAGTLEASHGRLGSAATDDQSASGIFSIGGLKIDGLKGSVKTSTANGTKMDANAEIAIDDIAANAPEANLRQKSISWRGRISAEENNGGPITIKGAGALASGGLEVRLGGPGLDLAQESASFEGDFVIGPGQTTATDGLVMKGNAKTKGTRIDAPELGLRLLELGALDLEGIDVAGGGDFRIARAAGRGLKAVAAIGKKVPEASDPKLEKGTKSKGPDTRQAVAIESISAESLALTGGNHIAVETVKVDKGEITLERDKDGTFGLVNSLTRLLAGSDQNASSSKGPGFTFSVASWELSGQSRLSFDDASVKPRVRITAKPVTLRIEGLDSRKPKTPMPLTLDAKLGRYGALALKGTVTPLAPRLGLNVSGNLAGLELSALRGYTRQFLGYDLTRGRLDAKLKAAIDEGKLKAESKLVIRKLEVKPSNAALAKPMTEHLQIPLESALALLRDSEDVIRLDLPISGDIGNPKFDFSDAINTALGNAMKKTVLATVKLAFPLGGIIMTVADVVGGKPGIRFAPVQFSAGEAQLSPGAEGQIGKLAKLLKERPALKITVCGQVTASDRQELTRRHESVLRAKNPAAAVPPQAEGGPVATPQPASGKPASKKPDIAGQAAKLAEAELPVLSRKRSEAVKDHLINKHGIGGERIYLCGAKDTAEKDPMAQPRADLYL